jgi:hypothetical protein
VNIVTSGIEKQGETGVKYFNIVPSFFVYIFIFMFSLAQICLDDALISLVYITSTHTDESYANQQNHDKFWLDSATTRRFNFESSHL